MELHGEPEPPATGGQLSGLIYGTPRGVVHAAEDADERATRRLAALHVRRQCTQHHCTVAGRTSACTHPNHRRDEHYIATMLDMLGLEDATEG